MLLGAISIYLFLGIIVTTFFASFFQSRGKAGYIKVVFLLCIAMDIYMFGYIQELNAVSLKLKSYWNGFEYLGIPFVSALWLTISLLYDDLFFPVRLWKLLLIYLIPVMTALLRFTNPFHHLYFSSIQILTAGDYSFLIKTKGPWYYVQSLHSAAMVIATFIIYIRAFIRRKDYDGKIVYMFGASIFASLGLLLNMLHIGKMNIDYMAICLPFSMLMIAAAILKKNFWEIKTLAQEIVFEENEAGMVLLDNRMRILDFNKMADAMFQEQGVTLKKGTVDAVFAGKNRLVQIMKAPGSNIWSMQNGQNVSYYEMTTMNVVQENGIKTGIIKTIRDVTQMQMFTNNLKLQATIDELSGLLNRREFFRLCNAQLGAQTTPGEFHLLMLDIDKFKNINDTYGHAVGDIVIKHFGELVKQNFRSTDVVGRLGGEEFAILIKTDSYESAYKKAEQLRKAVEEFPFQVEDKIIQITISIGVAATDAQTEDINALLNKADQAMYQSKNKGRNCTTHI